MESTRRKNFRSICDWIGTCCNSSILWSQAHPVVVELTWRILISQADCEVVKWVESVGDSTFCKLRSCIKVLSENKMSAVSSKKQDFYIPRSRIVVQNDLAFSDKYWFWITCVNPSSYCSSKIIYWWNHCCLIKSSNSIIILNEISNPFSR